MNSSTIARSFGDPTLTAVLRRLRKIPGRRFLNYPYGSVELTASALEWIEAGLDFRQDDRGRMYAVPKKKAVDALERVDR